MYVYVLRSRTSDAVKFEQRMHYGPIDLEGVATTWEAAKAMAEDVLLGYGEVDEYGMPDFNWKDDGFGRMSCTTRTGNYVTEWFIGAMEVQTMPTVKRIRESIDFRNERTGSIL